NTSMRKLFSQQKRKPDNMATILRRLPFSDQESEVTVGLERIRIKPCQIIVLVSISPWGLEKLPVGTPYFPAILDVGHNHNFSLQPRHLNTWARQPPAGFSKIGTITIKGQRVQLFGAHLWIHPNRPGQGTVQREFSFLDKIKERNGASSRRTRWSPFAPPWT